MSRLLSLPVGWESRSSALRDELLELLAHLEAGLDFVEEDIEFIAREELRASSVAAAVQMQL